MRTPNPPKVLLNGLTDEEQRYVIRLALLVVADLAAGKEWDAYGKVEVAKFDAVECKIAFWSLLDSSQRNTLKDIRELSKCRNAAQPAAEPSSDQAKQTDAIGS